MSAPGLSPGVFEGLVVAGEPFLGSHHAAVDVVANQVVEVFGRLPLDKDRRLGVPGGDHLARSRGHACTSEKSNTLFNESFGSYRKPT